MKKYVKFLLIAIFIGIVLAFVFYKDITREVRALTKKEEVISLFQVGVFKNESNATNFANTFSSSLVFKDGDYFRVIIAAVYHEEAKKKLEVFFSGEEINYYLKEVRVNKTLIKDVENFEKIILKSDNKEVINNVNNSILSLFRTYIN